MSNYTQVTFFAPKDALLSGDPNKIIHGTQVDPELAAIATAISSKFDVANMGSITQLAIGSGAVGAPSYSFNADTTTGWYLSAVGVLAAATGGVQRGTIGSSGNWTINAPGSGTAVTINGPPSAVNPGVLQLNSGVTSRAVQSDSTNVNGVYLAWSNSGTDVGYVGAAKALFTSGALTDFAITAVGANNLALGTNSIARLSISGSGDVTIAAPASGVALTVNGFGASGVSALVVAGANTAGARGLAITAGTVGSADYALVVQDVTAAHNLLLVQANGSFSAGPNAGSLAINSAGNVTINAPASGNALTVNSVGGTAIVAITANGPFYSSSAFAVGFTLNSSGANYGLIQNDSANTWSLAFGTLQNALGTPVFQWISTPQLLGRGPVAAALVDMTPDKGTFTMTLTGMTSATTVTAQWSRNGNQVIINIPVSTGTSNAPTFTCTGLPAAIQPANQQAVSVAQASLGAAGSFGPILGQVSGGTITWISSGSSNGFSSTGQKGFQSGATISYELN